MEQFIHSIKEWKPKIIERAEAMQKEMHLFIEETMKQNKNISYQDAVNTFVCLRLAQLEFETSKLWASQPSVLDTDFTKF